MCWARFVKLVVSGVVVQKRKTLSQNRAPCTVSETAMRALDRGYVHVPSSYYLHTFTCTKDNATHVMCLIVGTHNIVF